MIMELCKGHLAKALVLVVIVAEPTINSGLHGLCVKPEGTEAGHTGKWFDLEQVCNGKMGSSYRPSNLQRVANWDHIGM